eukprot:4783096-Prymnesium_polylepis.2
MTCCCVGLQCICATFGFPRIKDDAAACVLVGQAITDCGKHGGSRPSGLELKNSPPLRGLWGARM